MTILNRLFRLLFDRRIRKRDFISIKVQPESKRHAVTDYRDGHLTNKHWLGWKM